jgi:hypothetical protein
VKKKRVKPRRRQQFRSSAPQFDYFNNDEPLYNQGGSILLLRLFSPQAKS